MYNIAPGYFKTYDIYHCFPFVSFVAVKKLHLSINACLIHVSRDGNWVQRWHDENL